MRCKQEEYYTSRKDGEEVKERLINACEKGSKHREVQQNYAQANRLNPLETKGDASC